MEVPAEMQSVLLMKEGSVLCCGTAEEVLGSPEVPAQPELAETPSASEEPIQPEPAETPDTQEVPPQPEPVETPSVPEEPRGDSPEASS